MPRKPNCVFLCTERLHEMYCLSLIALLMNQMSRNGFCAVIFTSSISVTDKVPSNRMEILRRMRPSCVCDRANNYYPVMGGVSCDFKPRGCPKGRELQEDGKD